MDNPLVSIIIPVYNSEKYLAECIESAINQTWPNKEIIIVNDRSTDNSLELARKYESPNVKIFTQSNAGASAARNSGLAHALGEYIQFLDADDLLSANKIAAQMDILKNYPDHLGLCATVYFKDGDNPFAEKTVHEWFSDGTDDPADFLIRLYGGALVGPQFGGMVQPNAWLTPRRLIDRAGLWNEMRCPDDDGEFFCRVVLASKGIKYSFEAINYYRKFTDADTWSSKKNYEASSNLLQATKLKGQNLLKATNNPMAKIALSRLFFENAFAFYPYYKVLSKEAEQHAIALNSTHKFNPFNHGFKQMLTNLLGWKAVRYAQFLNAKRKRLS